MSDFQEFGDPDRFAIAIRWTRDSEPRERRPAAHGWSMGDLKLTVAGNVLTHNRRGKGHQGHVGWYLSPFLDWLASNWVDLLQEEDFSWNERSGAPAVATCRRALNRLIGATDSKGRQQYKDIQDWYLRHAMRSASEGGLFPDLFIRRYADDIELSWSSDPPVFAPEGFAFVAEPGVARFAVEDVARPLLGALDWAATNPPAALEGRDVERWKALSTKISALGKIEASEFERAYVNAHILDEARACLERIGRTELIQEHFTPEQPFLTEFSPAVAMFGGVSPSLGSSDIAHLCQILADHSPGQDTAGLSALVTGRQNAPLGVPHQDGYSFAEDLLGELSLPSDQDWIDIRTIVKDLGIEVVERDLETNSIRGVALAGATVSPTILINTKHIYNTEENGKRFTLAHELCHVIYDRTRARRVTHVSGPWAPPGIERRANAFAAYMLMPRELVMREWQHAKIDREFVSTLARRLHVNESALIEHIYNLDLIDELDRERLRTEFKTH
ncbi:ImmA/IrrE family metallo-endopeptidase [Bradyrhizobium sp. SZCCHNRI1009]|uniref:ImmA/IrrE family metallo-endopeptidase n=1 Tax=Bradyrhizobium sp. SZCCHNRI1009 TaxID=3057277 RepID=UPI0029167495|nr:ImmA/IrrE family metallo-endopeptidase [Bradyrhizobium sp. SZCCHNRI1009]